MGCSQTTDRSTSDSQVHEGAVTSKKITHKSDIIVSPQLQNTIDHDGHCIEITLPSWTAKHEKKLDEAIESIFNLSIPHQVLIEIGRYLKTTKYSNINNSILIPIYVYLRQCYSHRFIDELDDMTMNCDCKCGEYLFCWDLVNKKFLSNRIGQLKICLVCDKKNKGSSQQIVLRHCGCYPRGGGPVLKHNVYNGDPNMIKDQYVKFWHPAKSERFGLIRLYIREKYFDFDDKNMKTQMWHLVFDQRCIIYVLNVYDANGLKTFEKFLNFYFQSVESVMKMWPSYNKYEKFKSSLVICANNCDNDGDNDDDNDDDDKNAKINQQRLISSDQVIDVVKKHNIPYVEVSSVFDWNIQTLFSVAVLECLYTNSIDCFPYFY